MAINIKRYTVEDFEAFINLPENAHKTFELIAGEIVEIYINLHNSRTIKLITRAIKDFVRRQKLGHVTGDEVYFTPQNERYIPKLAFVSKKRQEPLMRISYNSVPPDLVVEFIFPNHNYRQSTIKIMNYLAVGTLVWLVYPETKEVEVYAPNQPVKVLGINDNLDGGKVLEGFQLPIREIFPEEE